MQNPVLDDIFKELFSYDSVFKEILEKVEKEKYDGTRVALFKDIFSKRRTFKSLATSVFGMQFPMKEKETMVFEQDNEQIEQNAGGKPIAKKDEEESADGDQLSNDPFDEWEIADILRKYCNLFGKEIHEHLRSSARYLLRLGAIYLSYAADWERLRIFINYASELEPILNELVQYSSSKDQNKLVTSTTKCDKVLTKYMETDGCVMVAREQSTDATIMMRAMILCFLNLQKREVMEDLRILFRASKKLKLMMEVNNGDGIQQNVNFVKAAALLVAAIVRCEIIKDSELIEIARTELCKLHQKIMKIDHVRGDRNVDICAFTEEIKRTLEFYRKEISAKLETITRIQEETNKSATQYDATVRVANVREICEQCTKYFLGIMAKVAEKCESIMGKPPCKFSIIGLGSLARKEVTLYSDFEHAILLEDGLSDYSEAIEYFRWFCTVFQVIIIGLRETVIPSVGVKSLNDFYSSDETKNWFRDEYTPCGVSFDGMMPHACKSPLGRQEPTKRRPHTVELIQPVSKMVNFVTKDEEVKNGYFLSDILSKICLVFGSRDVYDDYIQKLRDVVKSRTRDEIAAQQLNLIMRNPNFAVKSFSCINIVSDGKSKTSSYRPLTTLLSCAAAFHSLSAKSSFEIVDELRNLEIIDQQTHLRLVSAVGTAIEIRLKTYIQAGNQRENVTTTDLEEMVGKERLINCYLTLNMLKKLLIKDMYECLGGMPRFFAEYVMDFECSILILFEEYEKVMWSAMRSIRGIVQQFENSEITALESRLYLMQQFDYFFRCFIELFSYKGVNTQEHENLISSLQSQPWEWLHGVARKYCENEWYYQRVLLHKFLYTLYGWQGKLEYKQKEKLEAIRLNIKMLKTDNGSFESDIFRINPEFIKLMLQVMSPDQCLKHLNELLKDAQNLFNRCVLCLGICQALLAKGMKKQARESLSTLVTDISENSRRLGKFVFHYLLFQIHELQNDNGIDSMSVKILLRNNTHDVEQNKDLKASPRSPLDKWEYPYLQRKWADDNAISVDGRINWLNKLEELAPVVKMIAKGFSAFTRKTMIQGVDDMINKIKEEDNDPNFFLRLTAWLMVLCENCHASNLNYLIDFLQTTPDNVTAMPIIQPFLSALLADFIQLPTVTSTAQARDQLSQIYSKQRAVIQALFRYSGKGGNLHNLAIGHFKEFRFKECARLSWKQLHRRGNNQILQKISIRLFLTTTLATVVLQKRRSPAKYFDKTHEISLQQIYVMIATLCCVPRLKISLETSYWLYLYNFEDKDKNLVQVFNLAVEFYTTLPKVGANLLWKIVQAPNVTASLMKDSLHCLIILVNRIFQPKIEITETTRYGDSPDPFEHL